MTVVTGDSTDLETMETMVTVETVTVEKTVTVETVLTVEIVLFSLEAKWFAS